MIGGVVGGLVGVGVAVYAAPAVLGFLATGAGYANTHAVAFLVSRLMVSEAGTIVAGIATAGTTCGTSYAGAVGGAFLG